jgi:N-acetylmuramoyl-L-alanine amidase-like protein
MSDHDQWPFTPIGTEEGLAFVEVSGVRIYDARQLVPLAQYQDGIIEKMGYAVHHDAVAFTGFSIAEEVGRIQVIDNYHRNHNGWPGIGYHRIIAPSGRVYLVGSSSTQRAHVLNLNHLWIGYCFLGDWTAGRPPEPAMLALRTALQWETNQRGMSMQMRPHKALTAGTQCPGGWAAPDAWAGVVLNPQHPTPPLPGPPTVDPRLIRARDLINEVLEGR